MPLLQVNNLTHYFGGLQAVRDYHLTLESGEIHGLIGPNGAGKTTVFNLITGIHIPAGGSVLLEGKNIIGLPPHRIASRGLGRTFQNLCLWRHMTVLEHVAMAQYSRIQYGLIGAFFGTGRRKQEEAAIEKKSMDLLNLLDIGHLSDQVVTNLPYGAQRRVEMARALAMKPKVLFLDEPTAGMNPEELAQTMEIIRKVHTELGIAIVLIEHRLKLIMELCERVQTLVFGEVIAEGTPEEIRNNPAVIEAYLGKEEMH